MSIKRRIIYSVLVCAVLGVFLNVYNKFVLQEQADVSIEQLNGGDTEFGLALAASRDYSNYIIAFNALLLVCIWAPVAWTAIRTRNNA